MEQIIPTGQFKGCTFDEAYRKIHKKEHLIIGALQSTSRDLIVRDFKVWLLGKHATLTIRKSSTGIQFKSLEHLSHALVDIFPLESFGIKLNTGCVKIYDISRLNLKMFLEYINRYKQPSNLSLIHI